jgi:hypothetical protein
MRQAWMVAAGLVVLPSVTLADPGSYDKEFYANLNRSARVMRDGSIDAMIAEGWANRQAFEDLKAREAADASAPPHRYARQPRR